MTFYKATKTDGTDFRTGTIDYASALTTGGVVTHPRSKEMVPDEPSTYLSVSVEPGETLIGGRWPCRLFEIEPVGATLDGLSASKHKRAVLQLRVIRELPAHLALGPNGERVAALVERSTYIAALDEADKMDAAWGAARYAAWGAARYAAWGAAWDAAWGAARDAAWYAAWDAARGAAWDAARYAAWGAAWDAARGAAWDAASAEVVRDLITPEQYDILTGPFRAGVGDDWFEKHQARQASKS